MVINIYSRYDKFFSINIYYSKLVIKGNLVGPLLMELILIIMIFIQINVLIIDDKVLFSIAFILIFNSTILNER